MRTLSVEETCHIEWAYNWHLSMSLIEHSRVPCPGGRFPPSFIHEVIITGLNKLYVLARKIALDGCFKLLTDVIVPNNVRLNDAILTDVILLCRSMSY